MLEEQPAPTISTLRHTAGPRVMLQEQCWAILSGVPSAAVGSLAVAVIAYLVLRHSAPAPAAWWLLAMGLIQSTRLVLWRQIRFGILSIPAMSDPNQCLRALRLLSLATGCAWGVLALPLFPLDFAHITMVAVIASAVSGVALSNLYCDVRAAVYFYLGSLLPITLRLLTSDQFLGSALGTLGLLYFLYLIVTTRRLAASFAGAFAMRQYASEQTEALSTTERRFRNMYESSPDPVWILLNGAIVNCNRAALETLQQADQAFVIQRHPSDFSPVLQPNGMPSHAQLEVRLAKTMANHLERFEWMLQRADGSLFWAEFTLSLFTLDHQPAIYCVWRDIQTRKDLEYQVQFQLDHDPLTGLFNRYALGHLMPQTLEMAAQRGQAVAVGLIDLDNFKPINDAFGHAVGDRYLVDIAQRLQRCAGPNELVARLGGDEFVWVISGLATQDMVHGTPPALHQALQRLDDAIRGAFDGPEAVQVQMGMSMGIALFPNDDPMPEALLRKADEALYVAKRAKSTRQNWWQLWSASTKDTESNAAQAHRTHLSLFGPEAATILRNVQANLAHMLAHYFDEAMADETDASIFQRLRRTLTPEQSIAYRSVTLRQLETIFLPNLQVETLERLGKNMGRECAWRGFSLADCANFLMELQSFSQDWLGQMPLRHKDALALQHLVHGRSMLFLRAQQDGHAHLYNELQALLTELQTQETAWLEAGEFNVRLLNRLARIDGIAGAAAGRPDTDNRYVTEYAAGNAKGYNTDIEGTGLSLVFDASDISRLPPTMRAWVAPGIHTAANFWQDASLKSLQGLAAKRGFQSVAAFATHDHAGHPTSTYSIWGVFPGQFESAETRNWLESLGNFIERALQSTEYAAYHGKPISIFQRSHFRSLLFGNGLSMYMQPLIDLSTGTVCKVEALARLIDVHGEVISPGAFLPAFGAQELQRLYWKGLEQTLAWVHEWDQNGLTLDVTMNLPPAVLAHPDCLSWTREALAHSGIAANRLYLELLEHEDVAHIGTRIEALDAFRALGIHIVMDDLGAGHSSLLRLRTLPFSTVKIDQGLVKQALTDPAKTVPFIGALVSMAHGLDLDVVVEGLETPDLVEMAIGLGADVGQGYAIARPMPPEQVSTWAAQWHWQLRPDAPSTALGALAAQYRNAQKRGLRATAGKNPEPAFA